MEENLSRKRWYAMVFCFAVFLGALVSVPHWMHILSPQYQGIPVHFNADEYSYLPRVQEVLTGKLNRFGVAIAGGEELLPALQPGLIEQAYGLFFRSITDQAFDVFTVMDFVAPILLFIVMVGFCRACQLSRRRALVVAVLFSLLELYNLGRPIHQCMSFLLVLLSLWGLIEGLEGRWLRGLLGGVLMGLLIGVYFWSFSAAWAWWGLLLLYVLLQRSWSDAGKLLLFGVAGLVAGSPFLLAMRRLSEHLLYEEVFFRSGVGYSHMPESWPWTILFFVMAAGLLVLWRRNSRPSVYIVCTVVAAFVLLNQHLVHGVLFLFASHYLFFLVFAAVLTLVSLWGDKSKWSIAASLAAAVFLLGIAYDNRSVFFQWRIDAEDFSEQHLASALPMFDKFGRSVILADPLTSSFIASHTKHDVLFTHYIQHELRSHQEIAERYCLSQLPFVPDQRHPEEEPVLIYGAAYDTLFTDAEKTRLREQELALVDRTCATMDLDPRALLGEYRVQYFFWDEERQPEWKVPMLNVPVREVARGEGWSLWKIR